MTEPTLTERVRALAQDAAVEREELERRKAELLTEREAEVAKVRERYRVKLDEVERDLGLAERLRRALDPEGAKREAAVKRAAKKAAKQAASKQGPPGSPSQNWRPKPEVFASVFEAMSEGRETVNDIADAEGVNVSTSTVKLAIDYGRDEGLVRLAGTMPDRGGAKRWRLTPEGQEHLEHLSTPMNGSELVSNA